MNRERKRVHYIEPGTHPEAALLEQVLREIRTARYQTIRTSAIQAITSYGAHRAEIEGLNRDYRRSKRVEPTPGALLAGGAQVGGTRTPPGGWRVEPTPGVAGGDEGGGS